MTVIVNGARPMGLVSSAQLDPTFPAGDLVDQTYMWDFTTQGGAQSAITLTDGYGVAQAIPNKAVVIYVAIEEKTTVTGGAGSTMSIGYTGAAAGFLAATLVTNGIFTGGTVTPSTIVTPAAPIKAASALSVTITPGVNNLTAGKLYVRLLWFPGS